ncbi:MAG: inositol monophosphatase [Rhodospirillales bacterium]|nr:inositol monophosphatase [Rhodospirillales bacterium]
METNIAEALLRGITRQLAADFIAPAPDADLGSLIGGLRAINARASSWMKAGLAAAFPDIGWGAEESRADGIESGAKWIYDPIDGAYHFVQGLPLWSASLALVVDGKTEAAFVYEPALDEMFVAKRSGGASCNGQALHTSGKTTLPTSVFATAVPPARSVSAPLSKLALRSLQIVSDNCFVVRQLGAASLQLAYVAAGRLDGYWEVGDDVNDWLAGALIVQEAGGAVTDFAGHAFGPQANGIVAGPEVLRQRLQDFVHTAGD